MIKILQHIDYKDNLILRAKNATVKDSEFNSPELQEIIENMKKAMLKENDGVGIAAPQIGINKRIFIINSDKAFDSKSIWKPSVFINPVIKKLSSKFLEKHEGCLSVRGFYGYTWRAKNLTVEAQDINGKIFSYGAGGFPSHIIQHEIDHLNGMLFIDHAFDIIEDKDWKKHIKKEEEDRMNNTVSNITDKLK